MQKWGERIFSNRQLGMRIYIRIVMVMVLVNFATSKNLVVKSRMFPHRDILKYVWTSPEGKTHNQTDHIFIGRRWHSSILDVRSFRGDDYDTDHYLMAAKLGKEINKQHRNLMWRDLISGNYMIWSLGNSIRLIFQTGL